MATAIRAARLFDGVSAHLVHDALVRIDGTRIVEVASGVAPAADDVLDLGDVTLLPGLIDLHVHLAFDASTDPVSALAARDDDEALASMAAMARTAVLGGVTTVRDLGDRDYLSLSLRGRDGLPTILAAGPPITTPRGHCHFLGGEAEPGTEGIRRAVRDHAERGVDVIKVMASGGNLTPGTDPAVPQFTPEELAAAVDEAHAAGLPIVAHAHAPESVRRAIDAGMDGIEHVTFWTPEGVEAPDEVLALAAERRIAVSATVGTLPGHAPPPPIAARSEAIIGVMQRLRRAGALVVAGTDAGIGPPKPHDVLRHAVVDMVSSYGRDPADALRTVTSTAAEVLGLGTSKGRLAAGYDADLVAVGGDPFTDITALHDLRAVVVGGQRVR